MRRHRRIRAGVVYLAALLLLLSVGFPLIWMLLSSLKPSAQLFTSPPKFWSGSLTLEWYRSVAFSSGAPRLFLNSFLVAIWTTVICLTGGCFAAYSVTRFDFPGKQTFMIGALVSYVFPAIVLFVPIFFILNAIGLVDTLAGIVLAHTVLTFPLAVWMLRSFFLGIPKEIDEAAWVDGASYLRTFILVILPLTLPGIFSVGIFVFALSWNEYLFASILATSGINKTIPVGIAEYITSFDIRWGEIMALGTLTTIPVVVLFLGAQKYFLRGVLAGAVKG
ncbi:Inner membrane ABC transporter permease protein YcjP [Variovorax sp. SRS16]|uniref:carbohydrate ABC transporter permease n=1 Tax=Variovorax sp. SRS16 TaxID=282217 RepID=UPI001318C296|nr:carbohydrate ABC transporter permease [Variovorax sp. SRS16]VTU13265.1 Inner membrane ABC transporter permease protein YcjP [Variovorax sp. SRS16]